MCYARGIYNGFLKISETGKRSGGGVYYEMEAIPKRLEEEGLSWGTREEGIFRGKEERNAPASQADVNYPVNDLGFSFVVNNRFGGGEDKENRTKSEPVV